MNDTTLKIETTQGDGPHKTSTNTVVNWLRWPIFFVLDKNGKPSASKLMAFAILASNYMGHPVETVTAGLLLATCFGYSMFKDMTNKTTFTAAASGSVKLANEKFTSLKENITKTFAYTKNGEPSTSLPAQPDARTPAGDE